MIFSAIQTFKALISLGSDKAEAFDAPNQPTFPCPVCDQDMTLCNEKAITKYGLADARLHALKCDACGMVTDRIYHPSIGYDRTYVG